MKLITNFCIFLYTRVQAFVKEERGAVDIVAVVVLIGIAVALAVIFRTQISDLLNRLFESINKSADQAMGTTG